MLAYSIFVRTSNKKTGASPWKQDLPLTQALRIRSVADSGFTAFVRLQNQP